MARMHRSTSPVRPSMSQADMAKHAREQRRERERRGLVGYTRPGRREAEEGMTPGENRLQAGTRATQVSYSKSPYRRR